MGDGGREVEEGGAARDVDAQAADGAVNGGGRGGDGRDGRGGEERRDSADCASIIAVDATAIAEAMAAWVAGGDQSEDGREHRTSVGEGKKTYEQKAGGRR